MSKKDIGILFTILVIFLFGCELFEEDYEPTTEEEIIEEIISQDIEEPLKESEQSETKEEVETKPEIKEEPKEEKKVVEQKKVVYIPDPITPPTKAEPKTYEGKINTIYRSWEGVYSGDLTIQDPSYRHYTYSSKIELIRGDRVKFTLDKDTATVVEKIVELRTQPKEVEQINNEMPAGSELGTITKVSSTRLKTFTGVVRNAKTGKELRYETSIGLTVDDKVYYFPGSEPVVIAKKIVRGPSS